MQYINIFIFCTNFQEISVGEVGEWERGRWWNGGGAEQISNYNILPPPITNKWIITITHVTILLSLPLLLALSFLLSLPLLLALSFLLFLILFIPLTTNTIVWKLKDNTLVYKGRTQMSDLSLTPTTPSSSFYCCCHYYYCYYCCCYCYCFYCFYCCYWYVKKRKVCTRGRRGGLKTSPPPQGTSLLDVEGRGVISVPRNLFNTDPLTPDGLGARRPPLAWYVFQIANPYRFGVPSPQHAPEQ